LVVWLNVLMGKDWHHDDSDSTIIYVYKARWSVRRTQRNGWRRLAAESC